MCVYDIIKDHFNYKFIEKKPFHEYKYESEYGSNAFELLKGDTHFTRVLSSRLDDIRVLCSHFRIIQRFEYDAAIWVHLVDPRDNCQKAIL